MSTVNPVKNIGSGHTIVEAMNKLIKENYTLNDMVQFFGEERWPRNFAEATKVAYQQVPLEEGDLEGVPGADTPGSI